MDMGMAMEACALGLRAPRLLEDLVDAPRDAALPRHPKQLGHARIVAARVHGLAARDRAAPIRVQQAEDLLTAKVRVLL